jgi:cell division protein FtsI/penicillin-binding protein 2
VWSTVYQVGVIPDRLINSDQTAAGLANVTKIPKDQIEGQMDQAPSAEFIPLLTLSPADYKKMRTGLSQIPGLVIRARREQLFRSIAPDVVGSVGTETAPVLRINGEQYRPGTTVGQSGLQQAFQRQLTGTPETEVILQRAGLSPALLKAWPGTPGKPVHTTLDSTVQVAADKALDGQPTSGAIVAVRPGTGKILAVASRTAHGMPGLSPLAGQYKPGQAFTIISSAAILSAGLMSPNEQVLCPPSNMVDGISFRNNPPLTGVGPNPSFRTDFAHACSTAFVGLAELLTARDLTRASQWFGVGGWQLPVTSAFAGQIGQPVNPGVLAQDVIGSGGVRVSPLGMALAAAVVDSGAWHAPSLVTGLADPSATPRTTAGPQVLAELRSLMRATAGTGPNAVADVGGDVYGQAGSAPYGSGNLRLNWFVGYRHDVAFAVVDLSKSADASAAALTGSFLQNIASGG